MLRSIMCHCAIHYQDAFAGALVDAEDGLDIARVEAPVIQQRQLLTPLTRPVVAVAVVVLVAIAAAGPVVVVGVARAGRVDVT